MTPLLFCKHRSILQRLLMLKAACGGKIVEHTVSGAIVTFITNLVAPLKQLVAQINSVQDLNGYSYPWPAGGGKNLLDPAKCSTIGPSGAYGLTVTHDQATAIWTISGTPTSQNASLGFNFCTYSDFSLSGKGYQVQAFPISGTPIKNFYGFRNEAENRIAMIIDTVANPTVNMTFKVSVAATAQTAWSPYSNICPISGWTGANVTRTGKNLIDIPASVTKDGITFTKDSDGYVTASPSSGDPRSWGKNNAQFLVNLAPGNYKFVIKLKTPSSSQYSGWEIYSPTGVKIAGSSGGKFRADEVAAFTASTSGNYYIMAKLHTSVSRLMVVKDGADTSNYEPYSGDTYPITFPAAAGTVYGGTLDVTTGKLTVDMAMVDLGTKKWYTSTGAGRTRFRASITDIECISSPNIVAPMLCSAYKTETANNTYTGKQGISLQQNATDVYVYDAQRESMTTADFKTAMSGVQLAYKLATPQTYQLTPTEVTTLLGDNTIWASTGDVSVTYYAKE